MGSSPATGPTPNQGYEAEALQQLGVAIKQLEGMVPKLGATSDAGAAVLKALQNLAKFVPPGTVTPAGERNTLEKTMLNNQRNSMLLQQIRAAQAAQAAQGAGGAPPGGAPAAPQPGM